MSPKRIGLAITLFAVFGLALFGNHLNLEYRSLIASTQKAKPLLDEGTLDSYTRYLIDDLFLRMWNLPLSREPGNLENVYPKVSATPIVPIGC